MSAYSYIGAYIYSGLVVVIELGAYIHGVHAFNGCLLSRFYYHIMLNNVLSASSLPESLLS